MKMMLGAIPSRLLEHVPHARGAYAHEHLDELRRADAVERHPGSPAPRAPKRLSGAGRPDQQHAFRDLRADFLVLFGAFRNSIVSLSSCFTCPARHVIERHLRPLAA